MQYGAINKVVYFSVDGSPVQNRRAVVATNNCNRCHAELSLHGGLRNQTEYCVMCHNPANSDFTQRPSATVTAERSKPNQGIAFDLMVHRIHTGTNLPTMGRSYTIVGFGGSQNDFANNFQSLGTGVRYPAMDPTGAVHDTANCSLCHIGPTAVVTGTVGTETNLPHGKNAVVDPQGPINPDPAITAACTGCHATLPTASHAMANTTALGENPATACHSTQLDYSALDYFRSAPVHAQY